ncbi:hypothetical protein C7S17_5065 [Burkholderia thailandensis]|nr:hypothetical protein [Burkholderia thailandensis]
MAECARPVRRHRPARLRTATGGQPIALALALALARRAGGITP